MNRSIFVAAALCAVLLLGMAALRFRSEPAAEETSTRRDRLSASGPSTDPGADGYSGRRTTRGRNGAGTAPERAPSDRREMDDRRGHRPPAITRTDPATNSAGAIGDRRRADGADGRKHEGGVTLGGRLAPDVGNDDSRFRAAAEELAERDASAPAIEEEEEEAEDEAADDPSHKPPETPVVDDSTTYNSGDDRFALDSPFQIANSGDAGTVALWLQPEWPTDNQEDAAVFELGDGLFRVYKNVNVLRFEVMSDNPEHTAAMSIADWQAGDWHSISATWEGQQVTFYVDGQPVGAPIRGSFAMRGNTPVTIGALASPDQPVAPATISDISLRNRALPANEIARLHNRSPVVKQP